MNDIARIAALEARAQIADLVHQYAQDVRNGKFESCVSLFTEDATFEVCLAVPGEPNSAVTRSKLTGRTAMLAHLNEAAATGGSVCPLISNLIIKVQDREATSNCMMTATVWASGQTIIGEYHDSYRYDGEWRFTSRSYTIFRPRA